jgi:hypothetical protein
MVLPESQLITVEVTSEKHQKIEELARREGYDAVEEYLRHLIDLAVEETEAVDDDVDPAELFREGWRDIVTGNTVPASALWDEDE